MFLTAVSTFAPVGNVPVGDDYVIGPGDQLILYFWGRINQTLTLQVDRNGQIEIPNVEPLQIGGLTFATAKKLIDERVSLIKGTMIQVTMGQLRTVQLYVIGAVNQPGTYTVSGLSRVSAALVAAGGPQKIGSLRRVQLRRNNQIIQVIDFYDMLMRGDDAGDVRVENNDVIFVPVVGSVVGVVGDVNRPAIYELPGTTGTVRQALKLAGGVGPFSNTERAQILRVDNHRRMVAVDVAMSQLDSKHVLIHDGDLLRVYHVLPEHRAVVELTGNVRRPGEFQWRHGLRVSDLVQLGEGVNYHTFFGYALIKRLQEPSLRQRNISVDLEAALNHPGGPDDALLYDKDELDIFNEDNLRDLATVQIQGEIRQPGQYPLNLDTRVSDLIYMAGGLKDDAYREKIRLIRTEVVERRARPLLLHRCQPPESIERKPRG